MSQLRRLLGTRRFLRWEYGVVLVWIVLGLGAVTTSSIGAPPLVEDQAEGPSGLLVGTPRQIRSDEFLRNTPWRLGLTERPPGDLSSPLSSEDAEFVGVWSGGVFNTIAYPENGLLRVVGPFAPTIVFAFVWWLPVMVVLLAAPLVMQRLGVPRPLAIGMTLVIVFSPASVWWSWLALIPMAWGLVACLGAMRAAEAIEREGRQLTVFAWAALGGYGLARLGLSYPPWAIPVGLGLVAPIGFAQLVELRSMRRMVRLLAPLLATFLLVFGGFLLASSDSLGVISETVYPGSRRFSGVFVGIAPLFGAIHLGLLQTEPNLVNTNASEISSGLTVLALIGAVLLASTSWDRVGRMIRVYLGAAGATLLLLLLWCAADWPTPVERVVVLNLVSAGRCAQVIGLPATIWFTVGLSAWTSSRDGRRAHTAAVVVLALALIVGVASGTDLTRNYMPGLHADHVFLISAAFGLTLGILVALAGRRGAVIPLVAFMGASAVAVNPIQVGAGDLRKSEVARYVEKVRQRAPDSTWASDSLYVDALLMSNGASSMSGQQWVGPNVDAWERIDPTSDFEDSWNRGASYITFVWKEVDVPRVYTPSPDVIAIEIDPCSTALDSFDLRFVASGATLTSVACLRELYRFDWAGGEHVLYERRARREVL